MRHYKHRMSGRRYRRAAALVAAVSLSFGLATPITAAGATTRPLVQETTALAMALAGQKPAAADLKAFHELVAAADIGSPAAAELEQVVHDALAVGTNLSRWETAQAQTASSGSTSPDVDNLLLRIEYPPVVHDLVRLWANVLPEAEAFVRFLPDPRLIYVFSPPAGPPVRTVTPPRHPETYLAYQQDQLAFEAQHVNPQDGVGGGGMFYGYCDGWEVARGKSRNYGITGELNFCYDYEKIFGARKSEEIFLSNRLWPFAEYKFIRYIQDRGGYMAGLGADGRFRDQWGYEWNWQPEFETCLAKYGCLYRENIYIATLGYYDGTNAKDEPKHQESWM